MILRIPLGEHVWEGPKPTIGARGLHLKRQVGGLLGRLGIAALVSGEGGVHQAALVLSGDPLALSLRGQTFSGWAVDGCRVDAADIDEIELDPDRGLEPWIALLTAWMELGFFGARPPKEPPPKPEAEPGASPSS